MSKERSRTLYVLSFAWQLGFLIAIPLIGFMLGGLWIDGRLNTRPLFTLLGLAIGLVTTVYECAKLLKTLIQPKGDDNA
ncbi:AtpZ/AtpI family protein [candidate division WWE3 bacterium]|uniref:AtpZ/AtpI family protein n=1 Tax=candidate division WWE3 bacterium TaxID=2053526 RepID=A0A955RQM2_UNCKA|nr:AtpZ/AtpI family protein [candidate division WWE3 bacterium]